MFQFNVNKPYKYYFTELLATLYPILQLDQWSVWFMCSLFLSILLCYSFQLHIYWTLQPCCNCSFNMAVEPHTHEWCSKHRYPNLPLALFTNHLLIHPRMHSHRELPALQQLLLVRVKASPGPLNTNNRLVYMYLSSENIVYIWRSVFNTSTIQNARFQ